MLRLSPKAFSPMNLFSPFANTMKSVWWWWSPLGMGKLRQREAQLQLRAMRWVHSGCCPPQPSISGFLHTQRWDGFSQDEPRSFCASEDTSLLPFFFEQSLYLSHFTHLFIQLETYQDSLSYPPSCHGIVEPAKIDLCSYDPISLQIPRGLVVRELIKPQPSSLKTYWRPTHIQGLCFLSTSCHALAITHI